MAAEVSPFSNRRNNTGMDLEPILATIRDQILKDCRREVAEAMAAETKALRAEVATLAKRPNTVTVTSPQAPAPKVEVKVPDALPPDVEVDLSALLPVLQEIRDQLKKAQVRTVERDGDGRIKTIIDRRT